MGAGVGTRPRVMTDDATLSLTALEGIVRACDRFEAAWRKGLSPTIEEFLERSPAAQRPALLRELVTLEVELRRARGDAPTPHDYQDRFPDDASLIQALLETDPSGDARTFLRAPPSAPMWNLCVND